MKRFECSRGLGKAIVGAAFVFVGTSAQAAVSFGNVSPTKANGDFIPGTGIPAGQFTIETAATGEQAALKVRDRATGVPLGQLGNRYYVSAGNDPTNVNRAAWNFDFQFTPIAGKSASDYTYEIQADLDPTFGVANFVTLAVPGSVQAAPMGDSYYPNGTGGSISGGPTYSYNGLWSDATTPFVIANSQNYKFAHFAGPTFANADPGEYEIRFTVRDAVSGNTVATVTAFAEVPEPAGVGVLGVGAIAGLARRRRA
jgi:hypothetical protein